MQLFTQLFEALEQCNDSRRKQFYWQNYLSKASDQQAFVAISWMLGHYPKKVITKSRLEEWVNQSANLSEWLVDATQDLTKDIAESAALLLSSNETISNIQLTHLLEQIEVLRHLKVENQLSYMQELWSSFNREESYIFNKLLLGSCKINISLHEVIVGLENHFKIDRHQIIFNLHQDWNYSLQSLEKLVHLNNDILSNIKAYPFKTVTSGIKIDQLKLTKNWQVEECWEGIRCQVIKRNNQISIWSLGDEWLTEKLPEWNEWLDQLPNHSTIEGLVVGIVKGKMISTHQIMTRLRRKSVPKNKIEHPLSFVAYDLLQHNEIDLRSKFYSERRILLEQLLKPICADQLLLSSSRPFNSISQFNKIRVEARQKGAIGVILKDTLAKYTSTRKMDWIILVAEAYRIKAVLLYVTYSRSQMDMELTFAVRKGKELITFVKTNNGLLQEEMKKLNIFVKKNKIERFGPVRTVAATRVYELSFAGVFESPKHKAKLVLKSPKIENYLKDYTADDIDSYEYLCKIAGI